MKTVKWEVNTLSCILVVDKDLQAFGSRPYSPMWVTSTSQELLAVAKIAWSCLNFLNPTETDTWAEKGEKSGRFTSNLGNIFIRTAPVHEHLQKYGISKNNLGFWNEPKPGLRYIKTRVEKEETWRTGEQGSSLTLHKKKAQHSAKGEHNKQLFVHHRQGWETWTWGNRIGTPQEDGKAAGVRYDQTACWRKRCGRDRFVCVC